MNYNWYKIFNKPDFEALDIPSKEYEFLLEEIGLKTVLVVKGNLCGLFYEGTFLSLELNDNNPFEFDSHAIYIDDNDDVWLGLEVEE